jgi:hypothetical protein
LVRWENIFLCSIDHPAYWFSVVHMLDYMFGNQSDFPGLQTLSEEALNLLSNIPYESGLPAGDTAMFGMGVSPRSACMNLYTRDDLAKFVMYCPSDSPGCRL